MPTGQHGLYWQGEKLILNVHVQPRASRDEIVGPHADAIKIRITAPPVDGKANQHLIRFLASAFAVPRQRVQILSGEQGRDKRICIDAPTRIPEILRSINVN